MQPMTRVLGATLARDDDGNIIYEASPVGRNRRPKWNEAKPVSRVKHFKNAAERAHLERGVTYDEIEETSMSSFVKVHIYRGIDNKLYKQMIQNQKYQAKLNSKEWINGRIKRAMES